MIDFALKYRMNNDCELKCKISMGGELLDEVRKLKYLDLVLCKHGRMVELKQEN